MGGWLDRQAGQGHDVAACQHHETGPGGKPRVDDRQDVVDRRAELLGICRERILRLCHADRQVAEAQILKRLDRGLRFRLDRDVFGAIDLARHRPHLIGNLHLKFVKRLVVARTTLGDRDDLLGELDRTLAALRPVSAEHGFGPELLPADRLDQLAFGWRIGREGVDRDDRWDAELLHVVDVPPEVRHALLQRVEIFLAEVGLGEAAVHLQRADGCDDHRRFRLEAGLSALDVEELLRSQVGAKPGFRHDIVGEVEREIGRDDRVAAMRDIGERATRG